MVEYRDDSVFPAPRDRVWQLLAAHQDDATIGRIHPLIRTQRTVSRTETGSVVERTIDARGKLYRSTWKLTYRAPEFSRWEVVTSEGPWAVGSYVENSYTDAPGGTRIQTHGDLRITVLPFFLPQRRFVRNVLESVDTEDRAFLRA
ncbi:MAG TPA: SRPBCC family protein [Thermoplasmata archaeon]|nr:SRPBCC family protein [Thermoplasmata archaeon]